MVELLFASISFCLHAQSSSGTCSQYIHIFFRKMVRCSAADMHQFFIAGSQYILRLHTPNKIVKTGEVLPLRPIVLAIKGTGILTRVTTHNPRSKLFLLQSFRYNTSSKCVDKGYAMERIQRVGRTEGA